MKKFFSIAIASFLIVSSFASCRSSETETAPSSSSSKVVDDAVQEETTEEVTEEATEEETEEATEEETTESKEDSEEETTAADGEEATTVFELPELIPDDAVETDFVGKWECEKFFAPDGEYTEDFMGIPMCVFMQMEIKEDNTASAHSIFDGDDEEYSMTWTYDSNVVSFVNEDGDTTNCVMQGDNLVIYDDEMQMYLKKVDTFTEISDEEMEKILTDMAANLGFDSNDFTDDTAVTDSEAATDAATDDADGELVE